MYTLSDEQIAFIRDDIRARGVAMVSLQHDLLDHICCVIEHGLGPDGDFEAFYSQSIRTFFTDELAEIEKETITLLTFKHYYFMKKLMLFTGAVSTVALTAGLFFKFMHWPGASILIFLGAVLLSLVFLPLMFTLRIREKSTLRDKAIIGLGTVAGILISLSALFKMMHWPGANIMGVIALGLVLLVFLPVYFITGVRNPETKVNTIVSSIFIFYGCALILMLVRSQSASQKFMEMTAERIFRSESILSEQQKLTAYLTSGKPHATKASAAEIFKLCEHVKAFLIESETGRPVLSPGQIISETDAGRYFAKNPQIRQDLSRAILTITAYNQALPAGRQKIPNLSQIDERTVSDAINELIQAQMIVLQNQSAVALRN